MPSLSELLRPIDVTLDQLLLDPNNPRFADFGDTQTPVTEGRMADDRVQRDTFERMKDSRFDVAELRDTIKTIGFLPMDRIVVRKWNLAGPAQDPQKYIVVEGNRRITALKWLIELHDTGRENFEPTELANFTSFQALLLDETEAPDTARLILPGLRHVSGIKTWGAYQKARAVHVLRETGKPAREVAQSLGLSTVSANQLWRSYLAMDQMRNDEEFGEFVEPKIYSYFEETMKRPNVKEWLGWSDSERRFTNDARVREFYGWIVGEMSEDEEGESRREPKIPEAKSIRQLGKFLDDVGALAVFRSPEGDLNDALLTFQAEHREAWQGAVHQCVATLGDMNTDTVRGLAQEDLELIRRLKERAEQVLGDHQRLRA